MALRIFGVCLIVVGVALAIVSIRSLSDFSNMGRFMAEAGNAFSQPIRSDREPDGVDPPPL